MAKGARFENLKKKLLQEEEFLSESLTTVPQVSHVEDIVDNHRQEIVESLVPDIDDVDVITHPYEEPETLQIDEQDDRDEEDGVPTDHSSHSPVNHLTVLSLSKESADIIAKNFQIKKETMELQERKKLQQERKKLQQERLNKRMEMIFSASLKDIQKQFSGVQTLSHTMRKAMLAGIQHTLITFLRRHCISGRMDISVEDAMAAFKDIWNTYLQPYDVMGNKPGAVFTGALSHALVHNYFGSQKGKYFVRPYNKRDIRYYDAYKGIDIMVYDIEGFIESNLELIPMYLIDVKTSPQMGIDMWQRKLQDLPDMEDKEFVDRIKSDSAEIIQSFAAIPEVLAMLRARAAAEERQSFEVEYDISKVTLSSGMGPQALFRDKKQKVLDTFYPEFGDFFEKRKKGR